MKRVVSMAIAGFILLLTLGFFINDVRRQQVVLANDAYVWQRKWRVLAAEQDNRTKWSIVSPDWSVLTNTQRPVTAVVRIDGQLGELDDTGVERVVHLAHDWQARHINLVALEIDHDCASARLEQYAQTLRTIRQRLAPQIRLSITALPTWLESNALDHCLTLPMNPCCRFMPCWIQFMVFSTATKQNSGCATTRDAPNILGASPCPHTACAWLGINRAG